jgi:hypothetical protein
MLLRRGAGDSERALADEMVRFVWCFVGRERLGSMYVISRQMPVETLATACDFLSWVTTCEFQTPEPPILTRELVWRKEDIKRGIHNHTGGFF